MKRIRPTFIELAAVIAHVCAQRSTCVANQVGVAILSVDNMMIGTGYNGPAKGMPNCNEVGCAKFGPDGCPAGECVGIHAEVNAILHVSDRRLLEGATLVTTHMTCVKCTSHVVQMGIAKVVACQRYLRVSTDATTMVDEFAQAIANLKTGGVDFEWFQTESSNVQESIDSYRANSSQMLDEARTATKHPGNLSGYH